MHRARDVDHEDVVARRDGAGGHGLGRLDHREEEILGVLALALVEHQPRFDLLAREPVVEHEVAVVRRAAVGRQHDLGMAVLVALLHLDGMRRRADLLQAHRRVDAGLELEGGAGRHARAQRGLADPGRLRIRGLWAVVARAHHGGEHEGVVARLRHQQLAVAQFHLHVVARQDVGDVHLEHVRQVLLEQRGGLALALGGVVFDLRLLLLADLRGDQAVGQAHVEAAHGRLGRAREHVPGLDGALALVAVGLGHRHVGDHARNLHRDLGALERQPVDRGIVALHEEIGALGLQARRGRFLRMHGIQAQRDEARHREAQCRQPEPAAGSMG
jgi:hypothetical protein